MKEKVQVESSFFVATSTVTWEKKKKFCCIIVSNTEWNDRAISQNMPTIVYQTNRYWLSRCERWAFMALQAIPGRFKTFFVKLIYLMTRRNVTSHDHDRLSLHLHLHSLVSSSWNLMKMCCHFWVRTSQIKSN